MDAAATVSPSKPAGAERLLEHCAVFDHDRRPAARVRLEALLGSELTRRLVLALCSR
ncbi:MAG TPA: hypothetical protein VNT23_02715 [Gaiellaceae bacterium]|jgi:hypothetical protein|nr:hypothetical protein [Gaiellaceae bacterium]